MKEEKFIVDLFSSNFVLDANDLEMKRQKTFVGSIDDLTEK